MDQLKKDLFFLKDNVQDIVTGPLFNEKYQTVKITIDSPANTKIDIEHISLVIAINNKSQKTKTGFIIKSANEEFVKEVNQSFEAMKTPLPARIHWVCENFDTFLLKHFQWFERYNALESTGNTLRYYLRKVPAFVEKAQQQAKELAQQKQELKQNKSEQKLAVIDKIQQDIQGLQEQKQIEKVSQEKFTIKTISAADKPKFKLYSASDVKSLDQWEQEQEEALQKETEQKQQKQQAKIVPEIKHLMLHGLKIEWTDQHSKIFTQLINCLQEHSITSQLLQMCRYFIDSSIIFTSITKERIVLEFDYSFKNILDLQINSIYLKVLQEFIKSDGYFPIVLGINLEKPQQSFIRIDPQGEILSQISTFSRKLSQKPEITHQDVTDKSFFSQLSRIITFLLKYSYSQQKKVVETQNEIQSKIVIPMNIRTIQQQQIQKSIISSKEYNNLLMQLPQPFNQVPYIDTEIDIFSFITQKMPYIFSPACAKAADVVFNERIQDYLENEGYQETKNAEEQNQSDQENEEYEEVDEPSTSSESSVFESQGLIKDNFLADRDCTKNTICLKLTNFEIRGGLLIQLVKPIISIICTKCLKMMPLQLQPEASKNETGDFEEINVLSGTALCLSCNAKVELMVSSQIFNQFTQGECLFVQKHVNCLPVNIGYFGESISYIQCAGCDTLGMQTNMKEFAGQNRYSCRCPLCFKRIEFSFQDSYFLLPNGEQLPLPTGILKQQKPKVQQKLGPLPNQGTCQHAKHSYRWFRFACGGAYPCDTCHEKQCECGDKYAKMMICGFCGRSGAVQDFCAHCKMCLVAKRTAHWEGGKGIRNQNCMSRKDNKKYVGKMKTRSNKDKKRSFMQQRGNAKKRDGDAF